MVIAFPKIYPACQTDDNKIKLTVADKRVAEPFKAESLCIKHLIVMLEWAVQGMFQEEPVFLVKLPFFLRQVKIIQILDFNNWYTCGSDCTHSIIV